ncbi:MAG TPA: hypothetical protein VGN15_07230, partial [Ktedonobacteraceae bacterium]|nr:hypothetical protein [Ktedonobacteraceae bacterium]
MFIALDLVIATAQVKPEFRFQFTENPGTYSVGLKVAEQYDRSRVFATTMDEDGKPITSEGPRPL